MSVSESSSRAQGHIDSGVAISNNQELHLRPHWRPMLSSSLLITIESRLAKGKQSINVILRCSIENACLKALSESAGEPVTATGSGTPQWAVIG
jgi:hypothetical protein